VKRKMWKIFMSVILTFLWLRGMLAVQEIDWVLRFWWVESCWTSCWRFVVDCLMADVWENLNLNEAFFFFEIDEFELFLRRLSVVLLVSKSKYKSWLQQRTSQELPTTMFICYKHLETRTTAFP
jgi:hypothetical protein